MTESPFPLFGAVELSSATEDEPGSDSRRALVVLGTVAAVLVAAGSFFLLTGTDDTVVDSAFTARAPRVAAPAATAATLTLPVASKIELGRNPFKALYIQPAAAVVDPAAVGPAGPAPTVPGGLAPIVIVGPDGVPTSNSGGGTTQPAPVQEYKLVLTGVSGTGDALSAVFTIDGKQRTAKVGSTFGPTSEIKLLSLQQGPKNGQWTAVLQVGDGEPFDVVTGEAAFVR